MLCRLRLQHVDAGALCPVLLFFLLLLSNGQRKSSRALGPAVRHAHRTVRPPSTEQRAPVTSMESLRMIAVQKTAHIQKQQR